MNVAFVTARPPYPLNAGNRIRTFHLLRHVSRVHDVTLLTAVEGVAEREALPALCQQLPLVSVRAVEVPPRNSAHRRLLRALLSPIDPLPYTWARYRHRRFADHVRATLGNQRFDLVHCDQIQVAHALSALAGLPRLLNAHNVEHLLFRRMVECSPRHMKGPLIWQAAKTRRAERATFRRFDACVAVSEVDRARIERLVPGLPVAVVPNGVDTEWFTPQPRRAALPVMLFTGTLDWLPNVDGVQFFAREVLPRIRARLPRAELGVIGRNPSRSLADRLARDRVRLVGAVDDVRPHMAEASLFVVPLRIGGGTRLKILEAWAMGRPVLSTSIGAEGLPAVDGLNIALEDSPVGMAERAVDLLTNSGRSEALGVAGRRTVEREFAWPRIAGLLLEAYEATLSSAAGSAADAAPRADRGALTSARLLE